MTQRTVTVAVDAMGGDHAPAAVLEGVTAALASDPDLRVMLVGLPEVVRSFADVHERVEAVPASEVIAMDEHAATAVRSRKDSSIVIGCTMVAEGRADAFLSAGNTGAAMAAAILVIGRIEGVRRPAIATVIPGTAGDTVLLDVGANAEAKPEHLVQFAHMGAAYAAAALGVGEPRVALLNIGEEPSKGSQLAQDAHVLMSRDVPGFVGNVEGRDLPVTDADAVVTDGFTGNVALKLMEGLAETLLGEVRDVLLSSALTKVAAAVLKPSLSALRSRLDPDRQGGAPLLGVKGVCIIAHGSSGPDAIAAGVAVAARSVRGELTKRIATAVAADRR